MNNKDKNDKTKQHTDSNIKKKQVRKDKDLGSGLEQLPTDSSELKEVFCHADTHLDTPVQGNHADMHGDTGSIGFHIDTSGVEEHADMHLDKNIGS